MSTENKERRRNYRIPVTALFDSPEAVEQTLARLNVLGLPRDLIEVSVRPEGAERFYQKSSRTRRRDTYRFAAIGGLVGLIQGTILSFVIIALPGFQDPGLLSWLQLLGPNFGAIFGSVMGAIYGTFVRRKPAPWHVRLDEKENAILVVAMVHKKEEIDAVARLMAETGGQEVRAGVPGS